MISGRAVALGTTVADSMLVIKSTFNTFVESDVILESGQNFGLLSINVAIFTNVME